MSLMVSHFKSAAVRREESRRAEATAEWRRTASVGVDFLKNSGANRWVTPAEFIEYVAQTARVDESTVQLVLDDLETRRKVIYRLGEGIKLAPTGQGR